MYFAQQRIWVTDNLLLTEIHTLQTQRDGGKRELLLLSVRVFFNKRFFS